MSKPKPEQAPETKASEATEALDALRAEREARDDRTAFERIRTEVAGQLWQLSQHGFPPVEKDGEDRRRVTWYLDDEEFCRRWVAAWVPVIASLTKVLGRVGIESIHNIYLPERDSLRITPVRRHAIIAVGGHFVRMYGVVDAKTLHEDVVSDLVDIRRELGVDRQCLQEYFEALSMRVDGVRLGGRAPDARMQREESPVGHAEAAPADPLASDIQVIRTRLGQEDSAKAEKAIATYRRLAKCRSDYVLRSALLKDYGLPPTTVDQDVWTRKPPDVAKGGQGRGPRQFKRFYLLKLVRDRWTPRSL